MDLPVIEPSPPAVAGCSAGSCGSTARQMDDLSDAVRARVQDHPCYSEDAHHYFARMHVAVAPACNIQCHYCNRKYDCANESRPGVVSELLTPDQAVRKTLAVAATIPQMSVLGIAGPGDPLANPQRTFETFRQLALKAPDIKLCVSTNGLVLPEYVEELARYNIDHVTITINCVDPAVGARIYPWIFWKNRRVFGHEAAAILIAQQQKGLEMLAARGILVKVNSVLIPGVNDAHLPEVSKIVKAKGAFLHNVMPLIAEAEHGTFYGVMGQRSPRPAELKALQDACAGDMNMMRHCRQCRADAVGLLGEDRGAEFTLDKIESMEIDYEAAMVVRAELRAQIAAELAEKRARAHAATATATPQVIKIQPQVAKSAPPVGRPVLMAVAAKNGLVAVHFGHAREFLVYEASASGARLIGHRRAESYCAGDESCGDAEAVLAATIRALADCEVVLCSRIGYEPWGQLEAAGIQPNGEYAMQPIEEAVMAVWNEMLAAGKLAVGQSTAKRA
ncbi:MAG: nitrogenase cofactor biosynthesis protein NifB [Candidatus Accumulibacter phosphatis]|uniref:FeMo cofactor biosynthesis protein NifB n=5 Tax=Candidatus Accumulibacter TaxID=327159 RepID=A0A080M4I0_9PROT|nr:MULTISPECIES: nitrogenase cofactor biosynthesis protein NifB [Candidatus Accumulibacter]KFB75961.1 MAG: FeMo cofactor biosynthesis protein NifB [Candidatus Accumulibacter cognatus]MBL8400231.1 nitrogenase cofactor biosynthesis protein NifB [Accumulibacter sp.]MBN8519256.1 nitrogenase cofactor biosynthesis protein NifB [Accumulibacter sp.]MCC2867348.1 nitrogenase cofactor biosynthesis protein NifB [Candidatus Accumulibacter phosphatis]MCQ1548944.1 nitrogenase cofactor biosynthesis protein Ni